MLPTTTITKIPRTDESVDNSAFELKVPYEHTDDYGNTGIFYKKEIVSAAQYEAELAARKEAYTKELEVIADAEAKIAVIKQVDPIKVIK